TEVVDLMASMIIARHIRVMQRYIPPGAASETEKEQAKPLARSSQAPQPRRSQVVEEEEEDTFGPDVMQEPQAGALVKAAASGVPFCEECDKAAAKRAAEAQKSAAPVADEGPEE